MIKRANNSGFSAVEALLVIVLLGIIGFTGWFVLNAKHGTDTSYNNAANASTNSKVTKKNNHSTVKASDSTADWVSYVSTSGGFSIKYPKSWVTSSDAQGCPSGILLLGASSSSIGKCGTNNFGQMTITWQPIKGQCGLNGNDWTVNSTKNVTVSGISGLESTATSKAVTASGPVGTDTVQYCFITKSNMYVASYTKLASYPDVLSEFNTMVTKTLTFN